MVEKLFLLIWAALGRLVFSKIKKRSKSNRAPPERVNFPSTSDRSPTKELPMEERVTRETRPVSPPPPPRYRRPIPVEGVLMAALTILFGIIFAVEWWGVGASITTVLGTVIWYALIMGVLMAYTFLQ